MDRYPINGDIGEEEEEWEVLPDEVPTEVPAEPAKVPEKTPA